MFKHISGQLSKTYVEDWAETNLRSDFETLKKHKSDYCDILPPYIISSSDKCVW